MPSKLGGWGKEGFGLGGWGELSGAQAGLQVTQAFACAENVVRFSFSITPYVSSIQDFYDGGDPSHFTIVPVAGTVGWDGNPARPVSVLSSAVSTDRSGNLLTGIDVVLDRPMSPYPAQYTVSCSNLADQSLNFVLTPSTTSVVIYGLLKRIQRPGLDAAVPNRDFANPQSIVEGSTIGLDTSYGATAAGAGSPTLGSFVADSSGDYAIEGGLVAYKKRIIRRGLTSKNAFLHLPPGYGVGLTDAVKKLASTHVRDAMAADYERQIRQEPETARASVVAYSDPTTPQLTRFSVRAQTNTGGSVEFDHVFNSADGAFVGVFGSGV